MLNELAKEIHINACDHGWWEEERSLGDIIALCHSELSEALEEYRNGKEKIYYKCKAASKTPCPYPNELCDKNTYMNCQYQKPEGIGVELGDCIIRILDYCAHAGIDIEEAVRIKHEYNKIRTYRHGGKMI